MDGTGTIDQPSADVATATSQPASSSGSESVASDGAQAQENTAGGSQELPEGGRDQGTDARKPQFRSKNRTIYELRDSIRERDAKIAEFEQRLAQFEKKFNPSQERKPSRTFWEAPEEVMDERMREHLEAMEERLAQRWQETQSQSQQTAEWKQETSEAAKFIRGQKGLTEDDILEISSLIREEPIMEKMRPMERAEYAMFVYNRNKGVTDKTSLKNRASSVHGAAPQSVGPKQWTEQEIDQEFNKMGDPKDRSPERLAKVEAFKREIRKAYAENRVKKS